MYRTVKYDRLTSQRTMLYEGENLATAHIAFVEAWKSIPEDRRKEVYLVLYEEKGKSNGKTKIIEDITEGSAKLILREVLYHRREMNEG